MSEREKERLRGQSDISGWPFLDTKASNITTRAASRAVIVSTKSANVLRLTFPGCRATCAGLLPAQSEDDLMVSWWCGQVSSVPPVIASSSSFHLLWRHVSSARVVRVRLLRGKATMSLHQLRGNDTSEIYADVPPESVVFLIDTYVATLARSVSKQ